MKSLYIIYKIINKINNKFYIGIHKTKDINDDYYGSGHYIKAAIKKYGKENFYKEILHVYTNKVDAFKKEKELVTEDLVKSKMCYNIKEGGSGGFDHVRAAGLHRSTKGLKIIHNTLTNKIKKVKPEELNSYLQDGWALGFSPVALQRMSLGGKRKVQAPEHRKKNSEAKKNCKLLYNKQTNIHKFVNKELIGKYLQEGWEYKDYGAGTFNIIYNPTTYKQKRVLKTEINTWLEQGWMLGFSPATKQKLHNSWLLKE